MLQGSLEEAARVVSEKAREAAITIQEARARHDDTETMARQIVLVKSDVDVIQYVQNVRTFQNGR